MHLCSLEQMQEFMMSNPALCVEPLWNRELIEHSLLTDCQILLLLVPEIVRHIVLVPFGLFFGLCDL